jgi:hypothetical protein
MDGQGRDIDDSAEIGKQFTTQLCVNNVNGIAGLDPPVATINQNAVFEAARRLSQSLRIIPRYQFTGYAVENGKSILWFERRREISGGEEPIDLFEGIADSIAHTAPRCGWTNEWLLRVELKPYHPSSSSIWKPESFSDYLPMLNRCHFYSPEIANDPSLLWHTSYGQAAGGGVIAPESPSGWNYAPLVRTWNGRRSVNEDNGEGDPLEREYFAKSCQIYVAPAEVESAETVIESGVEIVKLTLTDRLQNTVDEIGGAPATVDRDRTGWDGPTIASEPYRTVENALRLYLVHTDTAYNPPATIGDCAWNSDVGSLPDNPYASIYPHFWFTKLVPLPYDDGNDGQDLDDTPLWHDQVAFIELNLRAICEGFVDGITSAAYGCASGIFAPFDFSYEALMLQSYGNRWPPLLSTAKRPDNPQGIGPYPNTEANAEYFNALVGAVNLLDRVRVHLPFELDYEYDIYYHQDQVTPQWSADGIGACSGAPCGLVWCGQPANADIPNGSSGGAGFGMIARTQAWLTGNCDPDDTWQLESGKFLLRWTYDLVEPAMENAVPESWRDMLSTSSLGMLCQVTRDTWRVNAAKVWAELDTSLCYGWRPWWNAIAGEGWWVDEVKLTAITCEVWPNAGQLDLGVPPVGAYAFGRVPGLSTCSPMCAVQVAVDPVYSAGSPPMSVYGAMVLTVPLV